MDKFVHSPQNTLWRTLRLQFLQDRTTTRAYRELQPHTKLLDQLIASRRKQNLDQAQLAALLHTQPRSIGRLEKGLNLPSLAFLQRIAKVLGVRIKIELED